ncbi:hypothetical protein SUGI_0756180 [Cryptomeria japonica]|uniref:metal transporter Nramp6.1 n=1 Tax=Cryptomeria japonica TaxID=3369 RepID=UPI002414836F|nr:metal transporter Nramp6.1 [Cryptomeria japonica]XP_057816199.2 metal transporter Nramp6.1 [Cryptomeria japonica]XP_057816200.2 metal transporter Nramp6.1 [Cryptomeria japonica]XP_057816202.2 metal transporter Nramp6.1 [Cryptomeria japonica]GLJ37280.1 hypothetical protein SUGI_0756180 [Cryptomeria japonica]
MEVESENHQLRDTNAEAKKTTESWVTSEGGALPISKTQKEKSWWRNLLEFIGPGFLVCIAYLDPGNLQTDLQAGAQYKYELLWIILVASVFALIIQSLAAKLGVSTGMHLAEHYRAEYPRKLNFILWMLAEVAVIAADIPEVIGSAFALNMLFRIPLWAGVLLTGLSTLLLLGLQRYGIRKLEMFVAALVFIMLGCFIGELAYAKANPTEIVRGMFVPGLTGNGATGLAISLLGALVMPHNLFLHSALVLSRKVPPSIPAINSAYKYFVAESAIALFVSFIINVSIVAVSGAICSRSDLPPEDVASCSDLDLNKSAFLLKNVLGQWNSKVFAVALLASGQSSTITGTYAGQYVMQGFLDLKIKTWLRNLITRCIAIVPSLAVSIISGSSGAGKLIIIASMILSFELPFALIPLLKFTSSKTKMGAHKNPIPIAVVAWILGLGIIGINIYYLSTGFGEWLVDNNLPKVATIFIGLIVFPLMLLYVVGILYLTFRAEKKETFIAPGVFTPETNNTPARELEGYTTSELHNNPRADMPIH